MTVNRPYPLVLPRLRIRFRPSQLEPVRYLTLGSFSLLFNCSSSCQLASTSHVPFWYGFVMRLVAIVTLSFVPHPARLRCNESPFEFTTSWPPDMSIHRQTDDIDGDASSDWDTIMEVCQCNEKSTCSFSQPLHETPATTPHLIRLAS